MIIALDACFKLKLKDHSFADPDLGTGLSYMVGEEDYKSHIARCEQTPPPKEVSFFLLFTPTLMVLTSTFPDHRLWLNAACG